MRSGPAASGETWVRFGPFEFRAAHRELRRDGRLVDVGHRGLDLLSALLGSAGQPVAKDRLMRAAWGERVVEHSNLTVQIATLRRLLGTGQGDPAPQAFIRTVPGYGYVFAAPVEHGPDAPAHPAGPPAPAPAPVAGRNWPAEPLTHFIGREKERRALARLLSGSRLVTLAGMGGVGKTRLAMRLSQELASAYADGVAFVDLAPLTEAPQVDEAVAAALGAGAGAVAAEAAVVNMLQGRQVLLIVDNAEHLSGPVGRLLGQILARCPRVSALVTSRESLGLPGEVVFRLSPLELPPDGDRLTAAGALGYDAIRLLVDRAQALLPDFTLDDEAAAHAAEICRRLDGIALAIEMAVPRLQVLSLPQLAGRLEDRFGGVAAQRHDVLPRQRTLRAMFDWSWELLSTQERRLLQLLAVSVAGSTLEALEALSAADGVVDPAGDGDVPGRLTRLAQSSLVSMTMPRCNRAGTPRYRLLETTRQYALDRLSPEAYGALCRLHAVAVAERFERAGAEWPTMPGAAWLDRYGLDADNLRSTMQWAFAQPGQGDLARRLAAASVPLWWELPGLPLREAKGWYALALADAGPQTPPGIEAWLLLGNSWTDTLDGDVENFPAVERAVGLFRAAQDRVGLGAALWRAASTVLMRADAEPSAPALLDEALSVLPHAASKWRALCHVREADLLQAGGDCLGALARYDLALAAMRALGYSYGLMVCGSNRSYALFALGRHADAVAALRSLDQELPQGFRAPLLSLLATTLAACGADAEARALALEGLGGTVTIGMGATLARSIEALALLVARSGDHAAAARFLGFALTRHAPARTRLGPRRVVFDRLRTMLAAALPDHAQEQLLADGASWTEDEAVAAARHHGTAAPA